MDPGASSVHVDLTRQQVSDSPPVDTDKPVSRQHEAEYLRYYGYPAYWGGVDVWGASSYPAFSRAALSAVSAETLRNSRCSATSRQATAICVARTRWMVTTSRRPMAISGTCRDSFSTTKRGPFAICGRYAKLVAVRKGRVARN